MSNLVAFSIINAQGAWQTTLGILGHQRNTPGNHNAHLCAATETGNDRCGGGRGVGTLSHCQGARGTAQPPCDAWRLRTA